MLSAGEVSEANELPEPSTLMSNCMSLGSGGGIGIDGVMQPAKPQTRTMFNAGRMSRLQPSKARSRAHYRIFRDLQRSSANRVGGQCKLRGPLDRRREHDRQADAEEDVLQEAVVVAELRVVTD